MTSQEIQELAGHRDVPPWVIKLVGDAIAKEREACAKVCYELPWKDMTKIPSNLAFAAAIRARGEA